MLNRLIHRERTVVPRSAARRRASGSFRFIGGTALALGLVSSVAGASAVSAGPAVAPTTAVGRAAADRGASSAIVQGGHSRVRSSPKTNPDASCTFNGQTTLVPNVTPGERIAIVCAGFSAFDSIAGGEISPLFFTTGSAEDIDPHIQSYAADGSGDFSGTFTIPNPFVAPDPAAVCPPTAAQVALGYLRCGLAFGNESGTIGALVALDYATTPPPSAPSVVGMASTPNGGGYLLGWSNGNVTTHGNAQYYGNASSLSLTQPIRHIVETPDGKGYWLVAADGGTFAYGDAGFYGSMGGVPLNKPVVDIAPTKDGKGYWLVASDGGIFAFGDAKFRGSMGDQPLNKPVVGISEDSTTGGYWLVASDGGIFSFDAPFYGSSGATMLNRPVNGMAATVSNKGYWFVASDGGVFAFGNAGFHGSTGGQVLNEPMVGMTADPVTGGYWLVGSDGGVFSFDAPFYGAG
jgi:hypothetical protein